jgi:hypothetical protein
MLPEGAAASRAAQKSALAGVLHERSTEKELGELLAKLQAANLDGQLDEWQLVGWGGVGWAGTAGGRVLAGGRLQADVETQAGGCAACGWSA